MKSTTIHSPSWVEDAAQTILQSGEEAIAACGVFRLGLSGGNSPRAIYERLAAISGELPWDRVQITFGDERCVRPDHPRSNFRMANEALLSTVSAAQVYRMEGELDPVVAADRYEHILQRLASASGESHYRHDLLLLGLGDDGHTASLFPDTDGLDEAYRSVVANHVPKFDEWRLTLTFRAINASRLVLFLVNDPAKKGVVDDVIAGLNAHPAGRVQPVDGRVVWLLGF